MKGDEVRVRARTLEDAVGKAAKKLGVGRHEVEFEVIRDIGQGLLGFMGGGLVTIRARPMAGPSPGAEPACGACPGDLHVDQDGTVEVVEGRVQICGPRGRGRPAVIRAAPGVRILVNGELLKDAHEVAEDDTILLEPRIDETPPEIEVSISRDKLTCSVKIAPKRTVQHVLRDQEPAATLLLVTDRHETCENAITCDDVNEALAERGVVFGLDLTALECAVTAADGIPCVVAAGEPPIEGKDGHVEITAELEPTTVTWEEDAASVDYWERYRFPFVQEGDTLAIIHPPVPGKPGRTVTGEELAPGKVREAAIRVGEGAALIDGGMRVVAGRAGMPTVYGHTKQSIGVEPAMIHDGDVGLASGHLRFESDVLVRGSVLEGARVEAGGSVTVLRYAAGAVLSAETGVKIQKSAVNCQVRTGRSHSVCSRLKATLDDLVSALAAADQLARARSSSSDGGSGIGSDTEHSKATISRMLDAKIAEMSQHIASIVGIRRDAGNEVPKDVSDLVHQVNQLSGRVVDGSASHSPALEALAELRAAAERLSLRLDRYALGGQGIVVGYGQNSTFDSSGDVIVTGQGCYNCELRAGKEVRIRGNVRGGEVFAVERVQAGSVGTPGEWPCATTIAVAAAGEIHMGVAYPDTTVRVGRQSYTFETTARGVRVRLDEDGMIVIRH